MSLPYGQDYGADGQPLSAPSDNSGQPCGLARVRATYRRWFGQGYDVGALDAVLCAAATERLGGDPPWLLVVGGAGAAKTETIMPLVGAGAVVVSTLNGEAALLSGTSRKERAKAATGGLLRQVGGRGLLVIKDVTSILSMNRDTRALVLAALREIYDGHWVRNVGTDGGQTLTWRGRLVVVGAVTTAWDAAYQVVSVMGDRFLLVRMDSSGDYRQAAGRQAMRNVSREDAMRRQLADAVTDLMSTVDPDRDLTVTDDTIDTLLGVADLVTRARTAVECSFQGDPLHAHGLEMPTRCAKQLVQIARGGLALGMDEKEALVTAQRCAADSVPPLRLAVLADVADHPGSFTADAVRRLQLPRTTVDRTLKELHLLGLLTVTDQPWGPSGAVRWSYSLADGISRDTLNELRATRNVSTPRESRE